MPYSFATESDINRTIAGIKAVEAMGRSPGYIPPRQRNNQNETDIARVTGPRDENGFYPGVWIWPKFKTTTTTSTSSTSSTSSTTSTCPPRPTTTIDPNYYVYEECLIWEMNSDYLEIGCNYFGIIGEHENGYAVLITSSSNTVGTCLPEETSVIRDNDCRGRAKWEWNFDNEEWDFVSADCQAPCYAEDPSECDHYDIPQFCYEGEDDGCAIAFTNCHTGDSLITQPECPPTTSTTTTPSPEQCPGCVWTCVPYVGWILKTKNCSNGVYCQDSCPTPTVVCPYPTSNNDLGTLDPGAGECFDETTPCRTFPPPRPCTGNCQWISDGVRWRLTSSTCTGATMLQGITETTGEVADCGTCGCSYPTTDPVDRCSMSNVTICTCPDGSYGDGGDCGDCTYKWSQLWHPELEEWIGYWQLMANGCGSGCDCVYPEGNGSELCEVRKSSCKTGSTTTTSTTSTTTTPPPDCNERYCVTKIVGCIPEGENSRVYFETACYPDGGGLGTISTDCLCDTAAYNQLWTTPNCTAVSVGTSVASEQGCGGLPTTTTTTTTAAPCTGNCQYECLQVGLGIYQYVYISNNCSPYGAGCECEGNPSLLPPCLAGASPVSLSCAGGTFPSTSTTTTTTSTTSTTSTSTTPIPCNTYSCTRVCVGGSSGPVTSPCPNGCNCPPIPGICVLGQSYNMSCSKPATSSTTSTTSPPPTSSTSTIPPPTSSTSTIPPPTSSTSTIPPPTSSTSTIPPP